MQNVTTQKPKAVWWRRIISAGLILSGALAWGVGSFAQDDASAPPTDSAVVEDPSTSDALASDTETSDPLSGMLPGTGERVVVLDLQGPIGPALARYIAGGIDDAQDAQLIVLEMDTPGGLDTSMREIIQAVLGSDVPVATYVSPSGARAASAGAYIMYASHIAAMAPGTAVGAATPVQMGGGTGGEGDEDAEEETAPVENPTDPRTALEAKAQNDAAALARSLAELRGRNADFAESMVRMAESVSASEALEMGVIEYQVASLDQLLTALDGVVIEMPFGEDILETEGAPVEHVGMTWIQQFITLITDPNIAFLLMSLGTLGLVAEFYNPGSFFPGITGAICLILAFYALSVIPFSTAGLALLIFGLVLMAAEIFVTSGGILAAAGFISFGLGAFFLFDSDVPGFNLDLRLLMGTLIVVGILLALLVIYALGAMTRKITSGPEDLIGMKGRVVVWTAEQRLVFVDGETWHATSKSELSEGQDVVVRGREGIVLQVKPA